MQETWVQSLDREDPLEEEMVTHSGILACRIPWTEKPHYSAWSLKESATTYWLNNNKWLWGNPNHLLTSRFIGLCPLSPYSLLFCKFFSSNFILAGWIHRPLLHLIFFHSKCHVLSNMLKWAWGTQFWQCLFPIELVFFWVSDSWKYHIAFQLIPLKAIRL